jgi:hypothetical protein
MGTVGVIVRGHFDSYIAFDFATVSGTATQRSSKAAAIHSWKLNRASNSEITIWISRRELIKCAIKPKQTAFEDDPKGYHLEGFDDESDITRVN